MNDLNHNFEKSVALALIDLKEKIGLMKCEVLFSVQCSFHFQDQVQHFLKDIFDLDKVRYSSVESLAEDMLHLLHRRSELLLAYLGAEVVRHVNTCSPPQVQLVPSPLLEAQVT